MENQREFVYNQNQRLIRAMEGATVLGEYVYNAKGQRVKKTDGEQTTLYHYDLQGSLIAESTADGTITAEYLYLNGQPVGKIEGNNLSFYHTDHLGAPMIMTDTTGAKAWEGEFMPFGEPMLISGGETNNLRFPGQYYDQETGLHQNWHRDYKAEIGRYFEKDPIGFEGGINLYAYAQNNPINRVDPTGLFSGPGIPGLDWFLGYNYFMNMAQRSAALCNSLAKGQCALMPLSVPLMTSMPNGTYLGVFIKICKDCNGKCNPSVYIGPATSGGWGNGI